MAFAKFPEKTQYIEKHLAELRTEIDRLNGVVLERAKKIKALSIFQSTDERTLRNIAHEIAEATNVLFARSAFPKEVVSLRRKLIEDIAVAMSDEITKATERSMCVTIKKDKALLQGICTHPFIFSYDGYEGSSSMDYDDQRHGHRVCQVCNLSEQSASTKRNEYVILGKIDQLSRRDLRRDNERPRGFREEEWFTLPFLRELFERSAGGFNIEWPKSIPKGAVFVSTSY